MSDYIEPIAHDTMRCRLPFPIGAEQEWLEVQISGLRTEQEGRGKPFSEAELRRVKDGNYPIRTVDVALSVSRLNYGFRESHESSRASFMWDGDGYFDSDGGCCVFETIELAIADRLLCAYSDDCLGLREPTATFSRGIQRARRDRARAEPLDVWQRRSEAERDAIIDADNTENQKEAQAARIILDGECQRLVGKSFDELLASGRPFDPEEYRYLDGAREYLDGSTDDNPRLSPSMQRRVIAAGSCPSRQGRLAGAALCHEVSAAGAPRLFQRP